MRTRVNAALQRIKPQAVADLDKTFVFYRLPGCHRFLQREFQVVLAQYQ